LRTKKQGTHLTLNEHDGDDDIIIIIIIIIVVKSGGMRGAGHLASMGQRRGVYRVLVGKPERKRPLGRLRRRWDDNIKIDLQKVEWGHEGE